MSESGVFKPVDAEALLQAESILRECMPQQLEADDGYYAGRIAQGLVLEPYELEILEYARSAFTPGTVRFIEAGAGWGILSIMLAVAGFEVIALTGEPLYCEALRRLAQRVGAAFPHLNRSLRIVEGFFPYALDTALLSGDRRNCLLSTNVIHEFTCANQDAFLAKAALCDDVIIDLITFGCERHPPEAHRLREFLLQGFTVERSLWRDRLLLLHSKATRAAVAGVRPAAPGWLYGETVHVLKSGFIAQGGACWSVQLPASLGAIGDTSEHPRRSSLRLLEDGMFLGPPHSMHAEIAAVGHGRYSHWHDVLYFSSSDNTPPATNGRKYTLVRAVL